MASIAPVFHLREVGTSINTIACRSYLKQGKIYTCSTLKDADQREKDKIRLEFKVRTVVDTRGFKDRYIRDPADLTTYVAESPNAINREDVLGLQYCAIALRGGAYRNQAWKRIPKWEKMKLFGQFVLNQNGFVPAIESVCKRYVEVGWIEETKRVLNVTPSQIGELFNSVLADPLAYPLVLAGGRLLRDSSILLLLILLLLEVPFEYIDQELTTAFDEVASHPRPSDIEMNNFQEFLAARKVWANAIREHIEVEHAGIVAYLCKVGVSSEAMAAIKEVLGTDMGEKQLIDVSVQEYSV